MTYYNTAVQFKPHGSIYFYNSFKKYERGDLVKVDSPFSGVVYVTVVGSLVGTRHYKKWIIEEKKKLKVI